MPAVVMNIPSPLPLSTTLVSPGDERHAGALGGLAHGSHHRAQRLYRQTFFENEPGAEVERAARRTWRDR